MKRVGHLARNGADADAWDHAQRMAMTPQERWECARLLREQIHGENPVDVRAAERQRE